MSQILFLIGGHFDSWKLATPFPLLPLLVIQLMFVAFSEHHHCYDIRKDVYTEDIHIVVVLTCWFSW